MSAFHESLKKIFAAVDSFLNTTLKNESLGKKSEKERLKILDLLQKLYTDYENLNPNNTDEGSSASSKDALQDESRNTLGSSHSNEDDAYNQDDIPDTTVKALSDPHKIAFLQRKKSDILGLFSSSKCYCVLHKNIFYWFKKPNDKKQQEAFFVTGYEFREIPQSDKEKSKKEYPFELIATGKKTYQFIAESKEDLDGWKQAIMAASQYVPTPSISEDFIEDGEDVYEPIEDVSNEVKLRMNPQDHAPPPDVPASSPKFHVPELDDFDQPIEDDFSETYDEALSEKMLAPQLPSRNPKSTLAQPPKSPSAQLPKTPPAQPPSPIDDDTEDIYEAVDANIPPHFASMRPPADHEPTTSVPDAPPPLPPHGNKPSDDSAPPPLPSRSGGFGQSSDKITKALPPLPQRKRILTLGNFIDAAEDYENLYYAMWKCIGATDNELTFNKGEMIHVINKELDLDDWWVGELKGKIGLVPKPFMMPAYELVA